MSASPPNPPPRVGARHEQSASDDEADRATPDVRLSRGTGGDGGAMGGDRLPPAQSRPFRGSRFPRERHDAPSVVAPPSTSHRPELRLSGTYHISRPSADHRP